MTGLAAGAPTKAVLADAATLNGTIDFDIDAGANKLTTGSAVTINAGKTVKTTGELEVATGHSLTNSGSLDVGTLTLTGTMDNQGTITAATAIAVNADGSTNSGNITGAGAMTIAANTTLATTDGEISIATLSFTDNTSILNRSGDATITSATINLNGADEGTVLPGGKAPATQPPVTPPTTTGPSYQIVWGNGGSNSTELWAKPSTSNPTGSDEWAKPSTDSNKTNPSMGGAR